MNINTLTDLFNFLECSEDGAGVTFSCQRLEFIPPAPTTARRSAFLNHRSLLNYRQARMQNFSRPWKTLVSNPGTQGLGYTGKSSWTPNIPLVTTDWLDTRASLQQGYSRFVRASS